MKRIYFDYSATTPVDTAVLRVMQPYFNEVFGNPSSLHSFGQSASRAVFASRRTIAESVGVNYQEIVFTASATEANNLALRGVMHNLKSQISNLKSFGAPKIIVSAIEHESVLETVKDLENEGVEVFHLPVSKEGFVDLARLKAALNERTLLVSVMYANNEIGSIQPIAEITKIIRDFRKQIAMPTGGQANRPPTGDLPKGDKAHSVNDSRLALSALPLFHTDAVQALQYLDCGVNNLGADLMTISAHKIYGPKGIGALYIRNNELGINNRKEKKNSRIHDSKFLIQPVITGGGQEQSLRSGTENVPTIVGFAEAVKLVTRRQREEVKRMAALRDYFWRGIKKIDPRAKLNNRFIEPDLEGKFLPNFLNIYFPGFVAQELLIKLDLAGIAVSAGSACSSRAAEPSYVLHALGMTDSSIRGSLRLTLGRFTNKEEIDKALKAFKIILKRS